MTRSGEETRKLLKKRLSDDPFINRAFEAFKLYMKLTDKHQEAAVAAMGCVLLLWMTSRKHTAILLAEKGWFAQLDLTLGVSKEVDKLVLDEETSAVDELLADVYTKKLKEIEKKVVAAFPNRKEVIQQAFRAHRKKLYYMSVPVFLSQTDGIAREMTSEEFFMKSKGRPRTSRFVDERIMNPICSPMFEILRADLPLSAPGQKRTQATGSLNRHAILHGLDTGYGTKINSLKALSLLSYMTSASKMLKQAEQPMEIIDQVLSIVSLDRSVFSSGEASELK